MNLFDTVSNLAVFVTFISFLTGLPICVQIWSNRSTKGTSAFPFMAGLISTGLWMNYSYQINDPFMIFINTCGFVCFSLYNLFFISMASKNQALFKQYVLLILILFTLVYGPKLTEEPLKNSGLTACVCGLTFFAAPLFQLKKIIVEKDVSSLPFWMILSSFFTSVLWFAFGYLVNDTYILLPNGIASILSGFQLSLFAIFPSKSESKKDQMSLLKETSEDI